jgi:hypothetical protein
MHQRDTLSPSPVHRAEDAAANNGAMARRYKRENDKLRRILDRILNYATVAPDRTPDEFKRSLAQIMVMASDTVVEMPADMAPTGAACPTCGRTY